MQPFGSLLTPESHEESYPRVTLLLPKQYKLFRCYQDEMHETIDYYAWIPLIDIPRAFEQARATVVEVLDACLQNPKVEEEQKTKERMKEILTSDENFAYWGELYVKQIKQISNKRRLELDHKLLVRSFLALVDNVLRTSGSDGAKSFFNDVIEAAWQPARDHAITYD